MKNPTDIALICVIVILALTCVAAGVLGYFTEGWTNWAILSETTTAVDDNSLSTESDGEIELLSSGYAFTSAESGYIEKAFLTLTAWASYWDIRKDIEWTVNYPNEYAAKKVAFSVSEDNIEGTLCCTGVFWGTITVSISLGEDVQSSVKVSFNPRYQALGLTDSVGEYDYTDMPLPNSAYWAVYPTFESRDCHVEFVPTGYVYNTIRIGLVNQFGELELIDQDGRSIYEQCEVSEPDNPVINVDFYYGGASSEYINNKDLNPTGEDFKTDTPYSIIAEYSKNHTVLSVPIFDFASADFELCNVAFVLGMINSSTVADGDNKNFAITKRAGEYQGTHWKDDDRYGYGFSAAYANTYSYSDIYGDWLEDPYYYTGFCYSFGPAYGKRVTPIHAYDANFDKLSPITITLSYGDFFLEVKFDFSRCEEAPA